MAESAVEAPAQDPGPALDPSPLVAPRVVLKLTEFPAWFESRLSENLKFELEVIKRLLDNIRTEISALRDVAKALRLLYANAAATPQITRIIKLCDQIDALASLYGQEFPKLPGSSYLTDLSLKLRNRVKTIDDMASSSKLVRTDPVVVSSLTRIRSIIQQLVATAEFLDVTQRQRAVITDYIDYIHLNVLDPILTLVQQNSSLSANQDTQQILSAAKDVSDTEAEYKQACKGDIFIKVMTLKRESHELQAALGDMLRPVQEAVKDPNVAAAFTRMDGISWHRNLVSMLSYSIAEMLKHCRFSNTLDVFCTALDEFLKLVHKDFFDMSTVPAEERRVISVCSAEELSSCLRRWCHCSKEADAIVASNEYGNAMKGLLKLRQQLRQAEQDYDAKVKLHATSVAKYNDVYGQMVSMRGVLIKICAVDLGVTGLSIVLPQETMP